ncbi:hypothetical protein KTR66_06845 [Roseococcus sp. SDR]|uniref:hypothetical protein n=1 Tax=Roseococcus sp. SDR TaxID=2835532 RepID=UPI001BCF3602|nr:hypothetical protein [Roseococcus sp. SDR]MBS7789703.1 hypothetical protein [Roseococcus sp. SDR]MBV1845017.1 hypothetical protein [Roseococcus sp. SDR]
MRHPQTRWTRLLALSALLVSTACAGHYGEEPLYVLRDSMGRSVAMAGASQLGGAAPGTRLNVNLGGVEQSVMVGERVGLGPVIRSGTAGASPVQAADASPAQSLPPASPEATAPAPALPPVAELPIMSGVTSAPLDPPSAAPAGGTAANRRAQRAVAAGENPTGRRRGPPPRSVSRSVM